MERFQFFRVLKDVVISFDLGGPFSPYFVFSGKHFGNASYCISGTLYRLSLLCGLFTIRACRVGFVSGFCFVLVHCSGGDHQSCSVTVVWCASKPLFDVFCRRAAPCPVATAPFGPLRFRRSRFASFARKVLGDRLLGYVSTGLPRWLFIPMLLDEKLGFSTA